MERAKLTASSDSGMVVSTAKVYQEDEVRTCESLET